MFEQMLSHMTFVDVFNWSVLLVFSICYIYQFYYVFVVLTRKPPLQVERLFSYGPDVRRKHVSFFMLPIC